MTALRQRFLKTPLEPMLKAPFIARSCWRADNGRMSFFRLAMTRIAHRLFAFPRWPAFLGLLALAAGLWFFTAARASPHDGAHDHELARQALEQGQVLPLRTVLDKVERAYPGQVLKVEFERDHGRYIYEIRLLQAGGKMVKLKVDAADGRVLQVKQKDKDH